MVTVGGHAPAGMPVVVVGAGGQVVQTMYQHEAVEGDEDEDGIDGDDEQEGDASTVDVSAMTGSMQMTGLADPMPIDRPTPSPEQQQQYQQRRNSFNMNHDMTQ